MKPDFHRLRSKFHGNLKELSALFDVTKGIGWVSWACFLKSRAARLNNFPMSFLFFSWQVHIQQAAHNAVQRGWSNGFCTIRDACMFFHEFSGHSPVITAGLQGNEACPSAGLASGALVWLGGWIAATRSGWGVGGGGLLLCNHVYAFGQMCWKVLCSDGPLQTLNLTLCARSF